MDDLISRNAILREIMGRPPEAHYPDYYAAIVQQIPAVCSVVVGDTGLAVGNVDFEKLCDKERLQQVWKHIEDRSQAITDGYVSVNDLYKVLRDEYEVVLWL